VIFFSTDVFLRTLARICFPKMCGALVLRSGAGLSLGCPSTARGHFAWPIWRARERPGAREPDAVEGGSPFADDSGPEVFEPCVRWKSEGARENDWWVAGADQARR